MYLLYGILTAVTGKNTASQLDSAQQRVGEGFEVVTCCPSMSAAPTMTDFTCRTPKYANGRACGHQRHRDIPRHRHVHAGEPYRRQRRNRCVVTGAAQQRLSDNGRKSELRYEDRLPSGGTAGCLT